MRPVPCAGSSVTKKHHRFRVGDIRLQSEKLHQVEEKLAERHANVRRLRRDSYEAVIGADPDNYAIAISASSTGRPAQMAEWSDPDEIIEAIAQ
jgi:hypothetical protein